MVGSVRAKIKVIVRGKGEGQGKTKKIERGEDELEERGGEGRGGGRLGRGV